MDKAKIQIHRTCEVKCFRFCICVCRCASHVSSGYEPQFVFQMHASFVSILVPMYVSYESHAASI
jgi:hypothetical protein